MPAIGTTQRDAEHYFHELSGLSVAELWQEAHAESVELRVDELAGALVGVGVRYNYGLPAGTSAGRTQIANFVRGLQLRDLALAQACALGRDAAWRAFMSGFREPLTRAAAAITGSASAGEELADSLWGEMFGLSERDGTRVSPLAGYSGRGSLMGFLRATLAQRNVDRHRRTHRETALPNADIPAQAVTAVPESGAIALVAAALREMLAAVDAEDRFLLAAWFLDQRTLLDISRVIHVHEATVSRRMQRLTARLHKDLLARLESAGMSGAAAEEALRIDPRDFDINLRSLLQASKSGAFPEKGDT